MKIFATVILCIVISTVGMAQAIPTFSRFFVQDSLTFNAGSAVIRDGDSLVLISEVWNGNTFQGFFFIKTDLSGNNVYRDIIQKNDTSFGGIQGLDAHRTSDGDFIIGTDLVNSNNHNAPLLIKLHNNLDTDCVRYIPHSSDLAYFDNAVELSDHNYLLTGCIGYADTSGDIETLYGWMVKTDTAGTVIWQQTDSTHVDFIYPSVFPGGVFLESEIVISDQEGQSGDSIIVVRKYDNDGNLKWTIGFGVPDHYNVNGPMIATQDGGGVLVVNIMDTANPQQGPVNMPAAIYKFDSNGNTLWQYWTNYAGGFSSVAETRSGSLILSATLNGAPSESILYPDLRGVLFKFDKDGNVIWNKSFSADTSNNDYFFDVTEASDGGIVAIGQATNPATGQLSSWLVKVDSNGCMNGDCPTLYTGIADVSAEQGRFMVFPSPAGVQYTVAVTETAYMQQYRDLAFCLYDLTGRMVYQQPLTDQATTIARGDLPTGMYIWHISDGGRNLSNGKIVMR